MIVTNYKIRQKIVKEELQGKNRVNYRKEGITNLFNVHTHVFANVFVTNAVFLLCHKHTQEFGRGYSI